ncbi:MAG TPA: LLM class F420-dependent oxidoreductase, partial [Ktedonobacteraceae bacterium]|nr:LLM class F420-dependent oxidoreductase [Ktedonobacteraceae bacterium]
RPAAFGQDAGEPTLEQKIAWVQEAAGERFAQLELARTEFDITISDSNAEVLQLSNMPPLPSRAMSTEQAVDYLREQRERYGFSYIQVNQAQAANFAPVVALLNGK